MLLDTAAPTAVPGLWSPQLRATTAGLVLTVTLVASEALAVITILPVISHDLGGISLYGWVISAFTISLMLLTASIATEFSARRWLQRH